MIGQVLFNMEIEHLRILAFAALMTPLAWPRHSAKGTHKCRFPSTSYPTRKEGYLTTTHEVQR